MTELDSFSPTEFISLVNQTLEYAYDSILITGEVASFKVNQNKWVFFDIKDEESSVSCFMPLWELRMPIEDGMKILVRGKPKVTKLGKFSFTVTAIKPVGEGNLKKAFEMLKKKLTAEGLFNVTKKRPIPKDLTKMGIISSTGAAGYADFIKIINARWGGMKVQVAHTLVQGLDAPDQIIRALNYFNEKSEVEMIAILRGGGSADDLSCFNDEKLVRAIAASKIPIITGIGHEIDESLADLAADVRASTPSNAAEMLTKDKKAEILRIRTAVFRAGQNLVRNLEPIKEACEKKVKQALEKIQNECLAYEKLLEQKMKILVALNPEKVLSRGYAILSGKISPGNVVKITTYKQEIEAEIKTVKER